MSNNKFSHMGHGEAEHLGHHVPGNLARDGAPKRNVPVMVHTGMTELQKSGMNVGGMSHATATVDGGQTIVASVAAAPLAHSYGLSPDLKSGRGVAPSFGQRSRTNEGIESHADKIRNGDDMLSSAVLSGSTDLRERSK